MYITSNPESTWSNAESQTNAADITKQQINASQQPGNRNFIDASVYVNACYLYNHFIYNNSEYFK